MTFESGARRFGSHYGQQKPWWLLSNFMKRIDMFGKEMPSFTLKGETHVGTYYGGFVTLIIFVLTLCFAGLKAVILVNRTNPNISHVRENTHFNGSEKINLNEINYRLAYIIENYDDRKTKNDKKYIKYIASLWTEINGKI